MRALALCAAVVGAVSESFGGESNFPFDRELLLDAAPLRNSRRIPAIEVSPSGSTWINLWCSSGIGQASVAADAIRIVPGPMVALPCAPEGLRRDEDLLAGLSGATGWRREGDGIVLTGSNTLRFRPASN
jgi:hypothetical protein